MVEGLNTEEKNAKEVDVHRIITTSFNVKLNPFIAYFEPKRCSFEVVITGGLKEIRPNRYTHPFADYANFLKDFRDELFRKSVNWKFPIESFISEFDPLLNFYSKILEFNGNASEKSILYKNLIKPLKVFLFSLDIEFQTNYYFYDKNEKSQEA